MVTRPSFAACCQMLEVLLNLLILACSSVSYNSRGATQASPAWGEFTTTSSWRAYSGFSGADGEKAQQLDIQFYQLKKLPTVTVAMACSGAFMAFCCLLLTLGVLRVPWHCPRCWWLKVCCTCLLPGHTSGLVLLFPQPLGCLMSPLCKERRHCTRSKGYSGFSCSFHGGDIGAGIFAALGIGVFAVGAVLAIRGYQKGQEAEGEACRNVWSLGF